jgi:membrane-associated phospholipid phosphatase
VTTASRARSARRGPTVRRWQDAVLIAGGVGLLALSALPVDARHVPAVEREVFRAVNDRTVLPFLAVWVVMQLGNITAVPVAALAAAAARRWRLAAGLLLGGVATYLLAKVVKGIVVRGRPDAMLPDVHVRGAEPLGRGYVSGHAAVVTLMVVLSWPYLGRRGRVAAVGAAVIVCWARMYVGAHLPLDIVGGVALGLAVAGVVRLLLGRPAVEY